MGSFNSSGFISKLPIKHGDRVVCFIGLHNKKMNGHELFYPDALVRPYFLPIRGEYDDYGSVENIDRTAVVEMLEKHGECDIKDIVDGIERCLYGNTINDNISYWESKDEDVNADWHSSMQEKYKKLIPLFTDKWIFNDGGDAYPVLMMEHEDVYDELFGIKPDKDSPYATLSSYVKGARTVYNRYADNAEISEIFADVIPSINCWDWSSKIPIDFLIGKNWNLVKDLRKLRDEHDISQGAFLTNADWHTFSFYHQLNTEERFKMYEQCEDEICKMLNMWYFFLGTPMYFVFSQTAGHQWYDMDNFVKMNEVIAKKTNKIIEEEEEW